MTRFSARKAALLVFALALALAPGLAAAEPLAEGDFDSAFSSFLGGEALVGSYRVEEADGARTIHLSADFKAKEAPDLKVFLIPIAPAKVTGKNATNGAVQIGVLKSFEGAQTYSIPAAVDLSKYQTIAIHCEEYSKLWGTSALR